MTFQELGEVLRQERLQRGLSMEEVMHETKVSRRHIEAIEEGRVEDLPHPVYVKGFVKIYARLLGVDIKGIGVAVDQAFASVIEDEHQEERRRSRIKKDIPLNVGNRRKGMPGVLVLLLVLLLLGGAGYGVWHFFFKADPGVEVGQPAASVEQEDAEPDIPAVVEPAPQIAAPPDDTAEPLAPAPVPEEPLVSGEGAQLPPAEEPVVQPQEGEPLVTGEQGAQEGEPLAQGEETAVVEEALRSVEQEPMVIASAQAQAAPADERLVLEVIGEGECWIEAKVDRDFTTDFYVRQGERVEIRFTRILAVKFGNLGVVSLRYNGAPYTTTVPPSGVKTLTFPPAP